MSFLLTVLLSLAATGALRPGLHRYEAVEPHMGTLVRITVYAAGDSEARTAFRIGFERIRSLDRTLSDYQADSELNEIARSAVGRAVAVSDDLFTVLAAAQELADATGGAFDITQGPVVRLWREARKGGRVPEPAALRAAAGRAGFRKLHLDAAHRTVTLDSAGMALDVGAIGKGFAASEAIEAIRGLGIRSALVAISGDLAFSEAPPGQRGWRVALHTDDAAIVGVPRVLELTNAAVSTSGASEQYLVAGGRRYSHIIDPASGIGLVDDITVTVIAPHGLAADGLDTAVSVLGAERGLRLIESRRDAAALILQRSGSGTAVRLSSRFREIASPPPDRMVTGGLPGRQRRMSHED